MKFKLELEKISVPFQIFFPQKIMLIGSCFTTQMAEKLSFYKYQILVNPHGIMFNPKSILNSINDCLFNKKYTQQELWQQEDLFHSWHHHSDFSNIKMEDGLAKINTSIHHGHHFLKSTNVLIITFGSAFMYQLKAEKSPDKTPFIVANNHQAPENWFEKKIYNAQEICKDYSALFKQIFSINPQVQIILTVSPVRHLREGVIKNNLSKAHLLQAVHQLEQSFEQVLYFPSYEIAIDILRDYRFYAEDLVHPNHQATQYIWEVFMETFLAKSDLPLLAEIKKIQDGLKHKPRFPNSVAYEKFINDLSSSISVLKEKYPALEF